MTVKSFGRQLYCRDEDDSCSKSRGEVETWTRTVDGWKRPVVGVGSNQEERDTGRIHGIPYSRTLPPVTETPSVKVYSGKCTGVRLLDSKNPETVG